MTKKAIITGVTGQDGSYLVEFLLKKNYIVHGIKRKSSSFNTSRIDHVFNNKNFYTENDAAEFYQYLDIKNDDGHAYYLGMELARAEIAFQLGKRYDQDEILKWGCSVEISEDDIMKFKTAGHTMRKIKNKNTD